MTTHKTSLFVCCNGRATEFTIHFHRLALIR